MQGVGSCGSGGRAAAGKEAHWILQSDRSAWKAFLASVECRAAGSLPGVAVGVSPVGPHQRPIPTFRHFREKLMTASVPWTSSSSSSTVPTPLDCQERPPEGRRGAGGPGRPAGSVDVCVGFFFSCVCCNLSLPKKERNIQIHLSSKWSFVAKEKHCPNSRIWR